MDKRQKMMQQWYLDEEIKVIQQLHKIYSEALKDINRNIKKQMERFDPETGDLPQSAIYQIKYQQMLKGQVEDVLNNLQTSQYLLMSDYLDDCYEDGFVGSVFDMHGQGVPLMMPIDRNAMVQAVTLDSKISKGLYTRLGEDITALKKKITSEVSRSILSGTSYAETARQLAGITRIGYNNAIRITRTEGHRIQVTATMDAMEAAKDRGADVVKQWDSTLDGRTRPSHRRVDGEIRELDESFSNGLKCPGDPNGRAAEVINCRCALLERARWAVGSGFSKRNNFTGELETFDTPDDYAKFKKDFFSNENVKYMNYVQQMQNKYGTSNFYEVLERMTDREYKHYSKLLNDNPIYKTKSAAKPVFIPAKTLKEAEEFAKQFVDENGFGAIGTSYAGVHLDVANDVNLALNEVFGSFDVPKLGGIAAPAKNTKLGKMVNAHAAYSPIRKSILMDRNKTKSATAMFNGLMEDKKAITNILTHPERYDFDKLTMRLRKIIEASSETGRSIVAENVTEAIIHELGHHLEKSVSDVDWDIVKSGMTDYATKVSGYCVDSPSEYFAESFTSYMKGEGCIDPELRAIFDKMRK